jgi:farnesyl diphosphate synthase
VQALERVSAAQRKTLESNYGQWDDKKVAKIKGLYKDLGLPAIFETYEEDSYKLIQAELKKVKLMPKEVFELLLDKIYKRSK